MSDDETHVPNPQSRAHWLFDRIILDPKIQIKYVDTKNQLADILTKGSVTRDEWDHLLRLFNIKSTYIFLCPFQLQSKRQMQEQQRGGEADRVVAKYRLARNLVSMTQSVSNRTEFEFISQPRECQSKLFKFGVL